ncbi:hypothetical protein [Pontibacter sp. SGAir0037]|uniref:hypothetical protein n=1 Tax=Pontibacter sp. SGAir0037 TaxID=2571030 RepID=UPI0010CD208F|nr:hypothetical protein [Pontibacter sp. SGAir0037]QCR22572.1 hypothetical protein C1N53_09640 [Pontibacter sp. SGAir0037]
MKLIGDIGRIKATRDSQNQDIEVHIDKVEYITSKKDGKYFQEFNYIDELDTPLILTGDCLALIVDKNAAEGEYDFKVYDKNGDDYELNSFKVLYLTTAYDFDADLTILTSVDYTVTVSNDAYKQMKAERNKEKKKKGKGRRN